MANCRKICVYRQFCEKTFPEYAGGEHGERPHVECPMAWKIEDILMDVPFCDEDYDGPEVEEL